MLRSRSVPSPRITPRRGTILRNYEPIFRVFHSSRSLRTNPWGHQSSGLASYHPPCPRSSPLERNTVSFGSHSCFVLTASRLSRGIAIFLAGAHDRWRGTWEEQSDASLTDGHTVLFLYRHAGESLFVSNITYCPLRSNSKNKKTLYAPIVVGCESESTLDFYFQELK